MIETQLNDGILIITMNAPPVNALGVALRSGILQAIRDAQDDVSLTAIVLTGTGRFFSAGADIGEFDQGLQQPSLPDLVNAIEGSDKPVIAAINGIALGGGLELALGCHYRIAGTDATLGLPEVKLGLLPGAGGTQRLPRLIGVGRAIELIVGGTSIGAGEAAAIGLVDKLADHGSLLAEAPSLAMSVEAPRRTGEIAIAADGAALDHALAKLGPKLIALDAPKACIEAVKAAAELALPDGLLFEQRLFTQLIDGEQSKALRHVFFAERAATRIEGLSPDLPLRPIDKVGVIGAGTMGGGISMNFLSAGIPVTIVETSRDALERGVAIIRKNYEASAAKGRISAAQVEAAMALLTPKLNFDALGDCDLVIEAVYEDMATKKDIFARLDKVARCGAMLASNTSFLSIDDIAAVTSRPQDVLGLHFFSPANVMKLLEVVRGAQTAPDALATAMQLARRIAKIPVVSGVCYGFIGNRMLLPRQDNATALLLEGATPEHVDRVHTAFGMPMGPFQMSDLAGVDIGWHRDPARVESLRDALCSENRWGQKTSAGWYDYDEKRRPAPSAKVMAIIDEFRRKAGVEPRPISDEEIVARTLYTMVNEGAHILEEGIAQRASDIDVVWLYGYGWPRHTGGPLFWADQVGLDKVVEGLNRHEALLGSAFKLSPLLRECAAAGKPLDRVTAA